VSPTSVATHLSRLREESSSNAPAPCGCHSHKSSGRPSDFSSSFRSMARAALMSLFAISASRNTFHDVQSTLGFPVLGDITDHGRLTWATAEVAIVFAGGPLGFGTHLPSSRGVTEKEDDIFKIPAHSSLEWVTGFVATTNSGRHSQSSISPSSSYRFTRQV
jgi:hypothetical protein